MTGQLEKPKAIVIRPGMADNQLRYHDVWNSMSNSTDNLINVSVQIFALFAIHDYFDEKAGELTILAIYGRQHRNRSRWAFFPLSH